MKINEKVIIKHSVNFTQEDYDIIRYAASIVYADMDIHSIINIDPRGLNKILNALEEVKLAVAHSTNLTADHYNHIDIIYDVLTAFRSRHPDDEHCGQAEELAMALIEARKLLLKELY